MAKIVTSQGLQDFVASGKPTETISGDKTASQAAKERLNAKLAASDKPEMKAETPPAPSPGETPSTETPPAPEPEAELDEDEKKFAKDIQKKIFKQIAKRKQAEAETKTAREEAAEAERFAEQLFNEREQWKRKADELEKAVPRGTKEVPKEPELVKPNPEDKKFYDAEGKFKVWEYSSELADFAAKKALADDRKQQQEARDKQQKEARERADAAAAEEFKKRLEKATEKRPDFMAVIESTPVILQNECLQYIARSVNGTELAYFLALPKNQERAEKIKGLSPYEGIAALRDLEIELGLAKSAAPTAAATPKEAEPARSPPAPITPIATNGAGTTQLDPAKMSFRELRQYERERAKRR